MLKVAVVQSETWVGARLQQQSGIMRRRGLRGGSSCVVTVTMGVRKWNHGGVAAATGIQGGFYIYPLFRERHASPQARISALSRVSQMNIGSSSVLVGTRGSGADSREKALVALLKPKPVRPRIAEPEVGR